ncbi:broad specificity phosphatase PhoE [Breznakia sp. PF5-3]|uniref:histidine phosphatase family protein n=1 Tax=unclassified Breznakia TaxID=2623764 RepID=UPI00240565B1|nr:MULTISPECIES: histidine phosphatase family protein [unclassified Breznakia]MDF9825068.1 broad specificity phosphatase PhoE [Breznakia sp. PM6-1]MDF9835915.1 broad specificity phosphatase PhoE [Breznakia sp. PF5-3]MDF9837376.1 broad specificity phosphatase PhoE [Breznakia sp. PFB2-8]MDF9859311.1 broad specificity phosphatase PhoE [Breznakia sp. PH5-24]
MNFYFIRHGKTYFNMYEKMQGWSDTPLIDEGIDNAKSSGVALADVVFENIYSSDLGRTIHTAKIIKEYNQSLVDKALITDSNFRETFFGGLEGDASKEVWGKVANEFGYNDVNELFAKQGDYIKISNTLQKIDPFKNAETYEDVVKRATKGINNIYNSAVNKDVNVLVVTHGNTIRKIVHSIDKRINVNQEIGNGSLTMVSYDGEKATIKEFNKSL